MESEKGRRRNVNRRLLGSLGPTILISHRVIVIKWEVDYDAYPRLE